MKDTWYPLDLPIRYESVARGSAKGCGRTRAMSSSIVWFTSDQDLPVGVLVWLWMSWPVQPPDGGGLSLCLFGRIERCSLREVEVKVTRHEFRTWPAAQSEGLGDVRVMARRAGSTELAARDSMDRAIRSGLAPKRFSCPR